MKETKQSDIVRRLLLDWGVVLAFAIFAIFVIARYPLFRNPLTWRNLFTQNADVGIIALGMTLVIVGAGIDLSVGSMLALAGVGGMLILNGLIGSGTPELVACMLTVGAIAIGAAVLGAVNGTVIARFRVAPFVATLVGLLVYRSLALAIANGSTVISQSQTEWSKVALSGLWIPLPPALQRPNLTALLVPWTVFVFIGVALALGFLLNHTPFGRRLTAVGSNAKAAKYAGVSVPAIRWWSYTILGACVGLAAWVASARLNSVTSTTLGQLYELDAIAAVVIGGTPLSGGRGRIFGTFIGVLLLGMITTTLVAEGVSGYWQGVVKGAIILIAVLIARDRNET